ncbi:MAG: RNA polymerase sigma factor FliA [Helicobacteraceae bacterium]|nr:RNA polymerase sigma factor FliA [Helicobacteraceae bacterium]
MKTAIDTYAAQQQHMQSQLAVSYIPAVKAMAHRMKERLPSSIEAGDLISIGTEELIKLAKRYNADINDNFWGFAKKRVHGAMLDFLRSLDTVSRGDRRLIKEVEKIIISYFGENNEEPSDEYLAEVMNEDIVKIQRARYAGDVYSLMSLDDQLQVFGHENTESIVMHDEVIERVTEILSSMGERDQLIIQLYFYEELNLKEISEILDITESRISQIIKSITRKIREKVG